MSGKLQVERKIAGKEQRRLNRRNLPEVMKRVEEFKRRGGKTIAVQAELTDLLDRNLLQFKLNPNPQNLRAVKRTAHQLRQVIKRAKLLDAEVNDHLKGLLDELPSVDDQENALPSGVSACYMTSI